MKPDKSILSKNLSDTSVYVYETTDSTNTRAHIIAQTDNSKRILVAANEQTAGKGRQGKSFYSPNSTGVYFSVVIRPDYTATQAVTLTTAVAVAVTRAIETLTELRPEIKWVNDIYIDGKKVCGILVQAYKNEFVIGVGINITTKVFPDEIPNAGSLNVDIDKNALITEITKNIFELTENPDNINIMNEYKKHSCVIGKEINYFINNVQYTAKAIDIDKNGGLIVEYNGTTKTLTSGEITIRVK